MSDEPPIVSLGARRFHNATHPAMLDPRTALEAAMEWLNDPTTPKAAHVIVIVGRDVEDGGSGTRYFQAGDYRHHGQMGLMLEGMHMIRESGK
jgi:hypothetical protein